MKSRLIVLSLAALLIAGVGMAGDKPWFDMQNCGMCKNITTKAGLMDNIKWEQHNIAKGVISITTVNDKFLDSYRKAHVDMTATGEKLSAGETVEMCGSCVALGKCLMQGVSQEYVKTSTGDVWILTSDKPELVTELQSWAKRNNEEKAKMKAETKAKKG